MSVTKVGLVMKTIVGEKKTEITGEQQIHAQSSLSLIYSSMCEVGRIRVAENGSRSHTTNHSQFGPQLPYTVTVSSFADEVAAMFPLQGKQKEQLRSLQTAE